MTAKDADQGFMRQAITVALRNVESGAGGPFGCVIARDGRLLAEGANRVTENCDPTAHAEVVAIRKACSQLGSFQLDGCTLYSSCEPCPMCMGAILWARPARVVFACDRIDAAAAGFDDAAIYAELAKEVGQRRMPMHQLLRAEGVTAFEAWADSTAKTPY